MTEESADPVQDLFKEFIHRISPFLLTHPERMMSSALSLMITCITVTLKPEHIDNFLDRLPEVIKTAVKSKTKEMEKVNEILAALEKHLAEQHEKE